MRKVIVLVALAATCVLLAQSSRKVAGRSGDHIQREVRNELLMLPYYSVFDDLKYSVSGYVVTLSGEVTDPLLKRNAEGVAKNIEGVEKVVDRIDVLPPSQMDDSLRLRLYHAIYAFPALEKYALPVVKPIRIVVRNGRIVLEGAVDSDADKNLATIRAKSVPGALSVTNNLLVPNPNNL